jgi:signal transduction histidine kinase
VYPVEIRRDPPAIAALRRRVESDIAAGSRYSIFDTSIEGVPYQIVALLAYEGITRERIDRVFGVAVNLQWARDRYFTDIVEQVAQIAGNASATSFAVIDEEARRVAGTLNPSARDTAATRAFPVLFFDPALVLVDPPSDLTQRSWLVVASAAGDPTFVLAARGARRSLIVVGAGVALLAFSLIATARAARASAAVATVRADFVATVTHELKTPLSTIRAVGETLVRGRVKTDQDLTRYAHLLVREERRLTRLVNNLLAYSRVTDVTQVYSFEALDPAALASEAAAGFRRQLTDTGVQLDMQLAPQAPAVRADRTSIVLALDNLIDNAIRHSEAANTVSIRVSEEADRVRFDVVDQGVGIPSEDLPKVRQRFVRGRTARSPGNGLGLAIVSRIAADHGGALEMTSAVGRGTTASLTIPKAEC